MNMLRLTLAYLADRRLGTLLNIALLALGVATLVILLQFTRQLESRLQRDAQGIDLVVGAKGSPIQLILSGVFHLDSPTGNVPLEAVALLRSQPSVAQAIPLALGDNFRGYRIVGTEAAYASLYGATLADGRMFERPMEVVIGSAVAAGTGAGLGQRFVGSHGLGDGGHSHDATPFIVVGRLKPTGTVIDRLILTPVESVWDAHGIAHDEPSANHAGHSHDDHDHGSKAAHDAAVPDTLKPEVTVILVRYRSAFGAVQIPGFVNRQTNYQAAVPAVELGRILSLVGVGIDTMRVLALLQMLTAGLSIFVALYGSLNRRLPDMALLRVVGATRGAVFGQLLLEGLLLALAGALAGLLLGHAALAAAAALFPELQSVGLNPWAFDPAEALIVAGALGLGLLAALVPALQVYRQDIARTLSDSP
jgi:putative ABC transport system permease protein